MTRTSSNLFAFAGGLAAGVIIGILYAPDSGKNTREKLRNRLKGYYSQLRNIVEEKKELQMKPGYQPSYQEQEDYRKAEELLFEVESILDELKAKSEPKEA